MQKITAFLWFKNQAEEAMNFYVSIFQNSKIVSVTPSGTGRCSATTTPPGETEAALPGTQP